MRHPQRLPATMNAKPVMMVPPTARQNHRPPGMQYAPNGMPMEHPQYPGQPQYGPTPYGDHMMGGEYMKQEYGQMQMMRAHRPPHPNGQDMPHHATVNNTYLNTNVQIQQLNIQVP
jgi:hypothetical protein